MRTHSDGPGRCSVIHFVNNPERRGKCDKNRDTVNVVAEKQCSPTEDVRMLLEDTHEVSSTPAKEASKAGTQRATEVDDADSLKRQSASGSSITCRARSVRGGVIQQRETVSDYSSRQRRHGQLKPIDSPRGAATPRSDSKRRSMTVFETTQNDVSRHIPALMDLDLTEGCVPRISPPVVMPIPGDRLSTPKVFKSILKTGSSVSSPHKRRCD